jgi:hypothetical protein
LQIAVCVFARPPRQRPCRVGFGTGAPSRLSAKRWKSFSSKESNKLLNRTGSFWQEDYFDHIIRDMRELHDTIEYVMNNPAKAGLRDWAFVRMYPERIPV